jgi:hypothetical protein
MGNPDGQEETLEEEFYQRHLEAPKYDDPMDWRVPATLQRTQPVKTKPGAWRTRHHQ